MKKINLLNIFGAAATLASIAPIIVTTSCSSSEVVSISADVGSRTYAVGDLLYKSDIRVYAKYKDGTTKIVNDFTVKQELPYEFKQEDVDTQMVFDVVAANHETFVTVIPTTNEVSMLDKQYINYINDYIKDKESLITCHDAVEFASSLGLNITNYELASKNQEIMYDITQHVFVIMSGSKLAYGPQGYVLPSNSSYLFKFVDSYNENCSNSQYFKKNFVYTSNELVISSGIDVGSNKNIDKIVYQTDLSKAGKIVPVRTYCDILTVNTNDSIIHLNGANSVYIEKAGKYIEVGKVAYLQAKNVEMEFRTWSVTDYCSIDTFNAVSGVTCQENCQDYGALVYTSIGQKLENLVIYYESLNIVNATQATDLTNRTESAFIQLQNDITLDTKWEVNEHLKFILDLNGHKLTAASTSATEYEKIIINEDAALILMDTKRVEQTAGSIELTDCSIAIKGGETVDKAANLLINGANINYTSTLDADNRCAIFVGQNDAYTSTTYVSNFYMYGGEITAKGTGTAPNTTNAYAISPRCSGSYIKMVYGSINTTNGSNCIVGDETYGNTYIDIIGGELITDATQACIYHPQTGVLNITDCYLQGGSCIAYKAGNISISGGTFISFGDVPNLTTGKTCAIDGSIFVLDAIDSYSLKPILTVSNATMYSRYNFIINAVGGYQDESANENSYSGYAEIDFFGGNYIYGKKTELTPSTPLELGYSYDATVFNASTTNLRIGKHNDAVWTYVKRS